MFKWLQRLDPNSSGLAKMMREFGHMIDDGQHIFDAAANAFLGGTDPEVIRSDLFKTDKRINHTEQKIRREILVHGTVYGATELPVCLKLMSIVKDAERIGDYSKNLFDLAVLTQKSHDDDFYADLVELKDRISAMLRKATSIYGSQDGEQARAFMREGDQLQDHCDEKIEALITSKSGSGEKAATALAYRYFKRVLAHSINIISSVVMPLDQLDYLDEDKRTRLGDQGGK